MSKMTPQQLAKHLREYDIEIDRNGIKKYADKGIYLKIDGYDYDEQAAQTIAKKRLLDDFLGIVGDDAMKILGISKVKDEDKPKVVKGYIRNESDESWSKLFDRELSLHDDKPYLERFLKRFFVEQLDDERKKHGSEWFNKVNWLELYKKFYNYALLKKERLDGRDGRDSIDDIIEKVVNEEYLDNKIKEDFRLQRNYIKQLFKSFDLKVNEQYRELLIKQAEETKAIDILGVLGLEDMPPEVIEKKFNSKKVKYYEWFVKQLLKNIYPDERKSILNYDEQLLGILFLDICDDETLPMVCGDELAIDRVLNSRKALYTNLSREGLIAYIDELRNGVPVEQYQEAYITYIEDHYVKIKTCSIYLLNEYLSESDVPTLTLIPIEEIKRIAKDKFGLPTPTFNV